MEQREPSAEHAAALAKAAAAMDEYERRERGEREPQCRRIGEERNPKSAALRRKFKGRR